MRKKPLNYVKLSFPSRSVNESMARSVAAAFVSQLDPTLEELSDVRTAVSEAVTNAVVHGYRGLNRDGANCRVRLTVSILPERVVRVCIRDKGCGIEDVERARTPLYTTDLRDIITINAT